MRLAGPHDGDCPCGCTPHYTFCYGRRYTGVQRLQPPYAPALMRTRYSAYGLRLENYLPETWHPSTLPDALPPESPGLRWPGLELHRHVLHDDLHATVKFVAMGQAYKGGSPPDPHDTRPEPSGRHLRSLLSTPRLNSARSCTRRSI